MRGRRLQPRRRAARAGQTPGRAGTTAGRADRVSVPVADPRACGDDPDPPKQKRTGAGRPPRVRGRPRPPQPPLRRCRQTPARAGTTHQDHDRYTSGTADPRACGDDCAVGAHRLRTGGRPPRVRGRRVLDLAQSVENRQTPARAGTTCSPTGMRQGPGADPRACGDDSGSVCGVAPGWGRPPRVRGRRWDTNLPRAAPGQTPARAGTTPAWSRASGQPTADPRACGDDGRRW